MTDAIAELCERRPELAPLAGDLRTAADLLIAAAAAGGKILIAGNGGSAADAEHWSAELLKGFESRRPLPAAERATLRPHLADRLQRGIACIPLTGFPALRTAMANDVDPALEFAQLVVALGRPGDVLVGLSTSGNAANVVAAAETAHARGLRVLALTGAGGGALAPLADVALRVPAERTRLVQELHLPVCHTLCLVIENEFFLAD